MHIKLYTKRNCLYCASAKIALIEKQVKFDVIELNPLMDKSLILQLNPDETFPILKERDNIIYDPEVVMLYIDERYPVPSLLPNYSVDRARSRLAMTRIDREWYSIINFIMQSTDTEKIEKAKLALIKSFKAIGPIFSENDFFMSDVMTLADCLLASLLYILPKYEIKLDESLGEISNYATRIFSRKSFITSINKNH